VNVLAPKVFEFRLDHTVYLPLIVGHDGGPWAAFGTSLANEIADRQARTPGGLTE